MLFKGVDRPPQPGSFEALIRRAVCPLGGLQVQTLCDCSVYCIVTQDTLNSRTSKSFYIASLDVPSALHFSTASFCLPLKPELEPPSVLMAATGARSRLIERFGSSLARPFFELLQKRPLASWPICFDILQQRSRFEELQRQNRWTKRRHHKNELEAALQNLDGG